MSLLIQHATNLDLFLWPDEEEVAPEDLYPNLNEILAKLPEAEENVEQSQLTLREKCTLALAISDGAVDLTFYPCLESFNSEHYLELYDALLAKADLETRFENESADGTDYIVGLGLDKDGLLSDEIRNLSPHYQEQLEDLAESIQPGLYTALRRTEVSLSPDRFSPRLNRLMGSVSLYVNSQSAIHQPPFNLTSFNAETGHLNTEPFTLTRTTGGNIIHTIQRDLVKKELLGIVDQEGRIITHVSTYEMSQHTVVQIRVKEDGTITQKEMQLREHSVSSLRQAQQATRHPRVSC